MIWVGWGCHLGVDLHGLVASEVGVMFSRKFEMKIGLEDEWTGKEVWGVE